jgi:hypothetical protein
MRIIAGCFLVAVVSLASPQSSQELRDLYREPDLERFIARPALVHRLTGPDRLSGSWKGPISYSPAADINQKRSIPTEKHSPCQRKALDSRSPPMANTIPAMESRPPKPKILISFGS